MKNVWTGISKKHAGKYSHFRIIFVNTYIGTKRKNWATEQTFQKGNYGYRPDSYINSNYTLAYSEVWNTKEKGSVTTIFEMNVFFVVVYTK